MKKSKTTTKKIKWTSQNGHPYLLEIFERDSRLYLNRAWRKCSGIYREVSSFDVIFKIEDLLHAGKIQELKDGKVF